MLFYFLSISSYFFLAVLASHSPLKRHAALAHRKREEVTTLHERGLQSFQGARATWYQTGLGGCGIVNKPSDPIVALNFPMFGNKYPGPMCFRKITIEYKGKTAVAQITDACEACPGYGGIDMSEGLFRYFADPGEGVISVNWWFGDSGEQPTTSHHTPTSTWTPPTLTVTTHHSQTPSPTSHSHSSSHTSSSSPSSSSSAPPPVHTPTGPNNIASLLQAVLGLGKLTVAGASD